MTAKPQKPATPAPPSWLTRAEKVRFRQLLTELTAGGAPVSSWQIDALADYCAHRSVLTALRRLLRTELRDAAEGGSSREATALVKQIETTAAFAARLADKLAAAPPLLSKS